MGEKQYTGRGIGLAVMDTGAFLHPDFRDRVVAFQDMVRRRRSCYDDNGHGTHILGIAAGDGRLSKARWAGVATGAHNIPVKVIETRGNCRVDNVHARGVNQ